AIDDTSLKIMAQSWPQLEHFLFGSAARWLVPPSLTFIGLIHLIHYCPLLRNIEMPFNACPVDVSSAPFSSTNPNEKLRGLFCGDFSDRPSHRRGLPTAQIDAQVDHCGLLHSNHAQLPVWSSLIQFEVDWSRVNDLLDVLTTNAKSREREQHMAVQCWWSGRTWGVMDIRAIFVVLHSLHSL
ncbi:hypothetical protein BDR07DRAFT_1582129, partial [Suillus spraguei]